MGEPGDVRSLVAGFQNLLPCRRQDASEIAQGDDHMHSVGADLVDDLLGRLRAGLGKELAGAHSDARVGVGLAYEFGPGSWIRRGGTGDSPAQAPPHG